MKIEAGDYIVGTKDIYIVIAVNGWFGKSYDLRCLTQAPGKIMYFEPSLGVEKCYELSNEIRSATESYINYLGKIVKKKDAQSLKILFG